MYFTLLEPTTTIAEVKERVQSSEGYPVEKQRLFLYSKELDNSKTLAEYGITEYAKLTVICGHE